jgi:arylsulfatase A-like enzyme
VKNVKILVSILVLINVVVIAWLLVRQPTAELEGGLGGTVEQALGDNTMAQSRYDLSDRAGDLNILLISMDALRWDRTGLAGHDGGLTPNLDAFAEEAVVFHNTVASASWTLPSHMSVWTSRWPSVHGVTNKLELLSQDKMVPTSLSPGIETYPDYLIRAGYTAAAFTGGAGVQASYGFGRDFETYQDDRPFAGMDYGVEPALEWLQAHRGARWFLFLHGYDSHGQYPLPDSKLEAVRADYQGSLDGGIDEQAELREQGLASIENPGDAADLTDTLDEADAAFLAAVYDRKVKDADERLGTFLNRFRSMGLLDDTLVIIMSDHGDELMEHGALDHGFTLYQEQLHVVMMMRFPGYARRQDITQPVRLLDLFPTVFDALGLEGPKGVDGASVLPMLRGETQNLPVFSETDYRLFVHHRMTRRGDHKLILDLADGEKELYDLAADPGETTDISSQNPRVTYELEQSLRGWMDETRTNPQDYMGIQQKPIEIF